MTTRSNPEHLPKLAYSIEEASAVTGLSQSYFHKLFNDGKLIRRKVGKRTFILSEELELYLRTRPSKKWNGGNGRSSVTDGEV